MDRWTFRSIDIGSNRGSIGLLYGIQYITGPATGYRNSYPEQTRVRLGFSVPLQEFLPTSISRMFGFGYDAYGDMRQFWVPHWLVALILVGIIRLTRRPKVVSASTPAICRVCGYDLRASPDRCPECGTNVATDAVAPATR